MSKNEETQYIFCRIRDSETNIKEFIVNLECDEVPLKLAI